MHTLCVAPSTLLVMQVIKDGVPGEFMESGKCFGEAALYLSDVRRTASVVTRTYCQLFMLSKNAMHNALGGKMDVCRELELRAIRLGDSYRRSLASQQAEDWGVVEGNKTEGQYDFGGLSFERGVAKSVTGAMTNTA